MLEWGLCADLWLYQEVSRVMRERRATGCFCIASGRTSTGKDGTLLETVVAVAVAVMMGWQAHGRDMVGIKSGCVGNLGKGQGAP